MHSPVRTWQAGISLDIVDGMQSLLANASRRVEFYTPDVYSGVANQCGMLCLGIKNGMGCFVAGCFVLHLYLSISCQSARKRRITRIGTHVFPLGRMIFARRESRVRMFF